MFWYVFNNKQMIKYNNDFLVKVKVIDFYESNWYGYRTERKILGFITRKEGVYQEVFGEYLGKEVPKHHTLKDGVVYGNPRCVLCYTDGSEKTFYFNNKREADEFSKNFTVGEKWLN